MEQTPSNANLGRRWIERRPTKTALFWCCVGTAVLTMIVGFTWGGWVRGATARSMAEAMAEEAVVQHLAPICAIQSETDPARDQKLEELKAMSSYRRADYVTKQGWATMPGESEADSRVAEECAKLIAA